MKTITEDVTLTRGVGRQCVRSLAVLVRDINIELSEDLMPFILFGLYLW